MTHSDRAGGGLSLIPIIAAGAICCQVALKIPDPVQKKPD
jgi:hypothetical protein